MDCRNRPTRDRDATGVDSTPAAIDSRGTLQYFQMRWTMVED